MITLAASAHCLAAGCEWTAAGSVAEVDRQADKHASRGHATVTLAAPVTPQ